MSNIEGNAQVAELQRLSLKVDLLAATISEKNKEIEAMKKEYKEKIARVEQIEKVYLKQLMQGSVVEEINEIRQLSNCQYCKEPLYDANKGIEDSYYILVPKFKPSLSHEEYESVLQNISQLSLDHKEGRIQDMNLPKNNTHSKKNKKKKCSYCNKTGHSRARCFDRLNHEKTL